MLALTWVKSAFRDQFVGSGMLGNGAEDLRAGAEAPLTAGEEECVIEWDMAGSLALLLPSPSSVDGAAPPSFGVMVMGDVGWVDDVVEKWAQKEHWGCSVE